MKNAPSPTSECRISQEKPADPGKGKKNGAFHCARGIIDDTIHLLVRYQRSREQGRQREQAFQHALHDVGHALLFTSVILVVGFGLFLLSGFRINSSMGAMISLSIAFALAFDFLCLPGLLMKFDKKTAKLT